MKKPPAKTLGTRIRFEASAAENLDPHAWVKFEQMIKRAAKMGHKPHAQPSKKAK